MSLSQADDFIQYQYAQEQRRTAYERYNYASVALELAQIKERLAELKSQCQPLDKLIEATPPGREQLYAAAFYAVVGRMPGRGVENKPA